MKKDIINKEIFKYIARDFSTYILKIDIKKDMEIIESKATLPIETQITIYFYTMHNDS